MQEQEIHLNSSRDQDTIQFYCSDTTWITKMDKKVKNAPHLFKVIAENEVSKTYEFPKRLLTIRNSITAHQYSEEQRREMGARLQSARDRKQQ